MSEFSNDLRALKLDYAEPEDASNGKTHGGSAAPAIPFVGGDSRQLARVLVALPAAILIDQSLAIESATHDISEGGLLLSGYHGPEILPGTRVSVVVKGIISDDPSEEGDHFAMEVVRSEGDRLALRFVS